MQAVSDIFDANAGLTPEDHRRVAYSTVPKGLPGHALDAPKRKLLFALLKSDLDRVPASVSPVSAYDDAALTPFTLRGRVQRSPGSRTTTGCRVHGC